MFFSAPAMYSAASIQAPRRPTSSTSLDLAVKTGGCSSSSSGSLSCIFTSSLLIRLIVGWEPWCSARKGQATRGSHPAPAPQLRSLIRGQRQLLSGVSSLLRGRLLLAFGVPLCCSALPNSVVLSLIHISESTRRP